MPGTLTPETGTTIHIEYESSDMGKIGVQSGTTVGTTNKCQYGNLYTGNAVR